MIDTEMLTAPTEETAVKEAIAVSSVRAGRGPIDLCDDPATASRRAEFHPERYPAAHHPHRGPRAPSPGNARVVTREAVAA